MAALSYALAALMFAAAAFLASRPWDITPEDGVAAGTAALLGLGFLAVAARARFRGV